MHKYFDNDMKCLKFTPFFLLFLLLSQRNTVQAQTLNKWVHAYWHYSFSVNEQLNLKVAAPVEFVSIPKSFETSFTSIALLKQQDKYYVSSNPLNLCVLFGGAVIKNIFAKESKSPAYSVAALIVLSPQMLTNFRLGYAPNENIAFLVGQHTDYFLFYKVSRICTESSIGLKLSNESFRATIDIRMPWTKGYSDNKRPYLNFGLSYFSNFPNSIY